ncbi:MAG: hypothetical protein ACRC67_16490 [Inquilinus sp.]|uniref:hypothetical protein n=1 Tax=Inquilinus sp. TaxID=1932117 RepID=UPI003F407EB9
MAQRHHDSAGWSADETWNELGRIREAIEECIPNRLIGAGKEAKPTLERENLALAESVRLMGAHMPEQRDVAVPAEFRAWTADASDAGSADFDDADRSPSTRGLP